MLRYFLFAILLLSPAALPAQDPKSLKAGDAVPSNFRAFLVGDDRYEKGNPRNRIRKMHDLVADYGLNPVLIAFVPTVPEAEKPIEKLALEMSDLVNEFKAQRLGGAMIFLTLDAEYPAEDNTDKKADKKAEVIENFWRHIDGKMPVIDEVKKEKRRVRVPFGIAPKKSESVTAWGLGGVEHLRVMYYDRMIVKRTWAFNDDKPPTAEDLKAIRTYVESELKPKK